MKRIEAIISGRVQMVMFRDFTKRQADKLGVVGFVENRSDGTVYVIAEGEEDVLTTFIKKLGKGPMTARVDNMSVEWQDAQQVYDAFTINYY